jgi:ATP-binding cassette subfamily B protein
MRTVIGSTKALRQDASVLQQKIKPDTLRRIVAVASPFFGMLALFLLIVSLDAVIGVINPLLYRELINQGILLGNADLVVRIALLAALLYVVDAALGLLQSWLAAIIGGRVVLSLRSRLFDHIQKMPLAFFTRTQTGALISRLNNDVLGAQQAFTSTASNVMSNVLTVLLTLIFMFTLSWQITAMALVLLPVFVIPARLIGGRLQQLTREAYNLNAQMNTTMTERFNVAGALLVKLFGRPEDENAQFQVRAGRVRDIGVSTSMLSTVFVVSLTLVASLATALVYGFGGRLAAEGSLDVGTVVALATYLTQLYGPLTNLSNLRVDIMTALVSFERVFEVLDLPPAIADAPDALDLPADTPATVELRDVTFRYPSAEEVSLASLESVAVLETTVPHEVLHGVSLRAGAGEMVALVGPSGAGKTTISQLVSRMYDVTGGAVLLGGHDVRALTLSSLRQAVGVVTQDAHLFHDTVRANLSYARPEATDAQMWEALEQAHIAELVRDFDDGLDTVVGDRGYRLSGGEKQRIAIARLLLDEATAHLDSESEHAVQQALATALAGRTSLVIAHRLSTVRDADRIVVIEDGRVVETGRHEELLARQGLYADLYRTQFADADPGTDGAPDPVGEPLAG